MGIRDIIRDTMPAWSKDRLEYLRQKFARPDIDQVVINDYVFQADPGQTARLTLLLPRMSVSSAYGGVMTGFKVFFELVSRLRKSSACDVRLIFDAGYENELREVLELVGIGKYVPVGEIEILRKNETPVVATRKNDLFICYNWWTVLNARNLVERQQAYFGGARRPLTHIIQDYEPLFYPMSSAHMLARAAFDLDWPVWGIFNSSHLYNYFRLQGHEMERHFVFEPALHEKLLPYVTQQAAGTKERMLLIYGRGYEARNCFSLVKAALERWSRDCPSSPSWKVRSLGSPHLPIRLADGRLIHSEGKLSLEAYAETLQKAAVGISLMASPHPSYPPLEMAHFGVRTITNRFTGKDLSSSHDNIISLSGLHPAALARAICEACSEFELHPAAGLDAKSHLPRYLSGFDLSVLDDAAAHMAATLS